MLLGYFSTFQGESQMLLLKELTEHSQKVLSTQVVKSYHIVMSALKNLGVIKRKLQTSEGVKFQIDLEKACKLAEERNVENKAHSDTVQLEDLKAVYWSAELYGEHPCCICGYQKLTSWQAETFKGDKLGICDDCRLEWEKRRNNID